MHEAMLAAAEKFYGVPLRLRTSRSIHGARWFADLLDDDGRVVASWDADTEDDAIRGVY